MNLTSSLALLKKHFANAVVFSDKNYYAEYIELLHQTSDFNLRINRAVMKSALENKSWGTIADAAYICFHELFDLTKKWVMQFDPHNNDIVTLKENHSLEDLANKFADEVVDKLKTR